MPLIETKTQTHATTIAASLMVGVSATAMLMTWGMMAVSGFFQIAANPPDYNPCAQRTDCSLTVDTRQKFDQLTASYDRLDVPGTFIPGSFISALVPKSELLNELCTLSAHCPRFPIFYNREGLPLDDLLKIWFPELFGGDDVQVLNMLKGFFDSSYIYRIQEETEEIYAFTVPYNVPGPTAVSNFYQALKVKFLVGDPHFYVYGMHRSIVDLVRSWTNPPFPIYYDIYFTDRVESEATYKKLTRCASLSRCRILHITPRHPQVDGYCQDFTQRGLPCLKTPLYAFSRLVDNEHVFIVDWLYPEQTAGRTRQQTVNLLFGRDGVYYSGSIWRKPLEPFYRFTIYTDVGSSGDAVYPTILEDVRAVYQQLDETFDIGELRFEPTRPQETIAKTWIDPGFGIVFRGDPPVYESYTTGTAYGRVQILSRESFAEIRDTVGFGFQDFLVFQEEPFDVEAPVAGIVTGTQQLPSASHVALRFARRNTPNAYLKNIAMFEPYVGKLVKVEVSASDLKITEVEPVEAEAWWTEHRIKIAPPAPVDRTYRGLDLVQSMSDDPTTPFSRFGGKTSNLQKLYSIIEPKYQLTAFGIPFSYFYDFIESNKVISSTSFPAGCKYSGLTYKQFMEKLLDSADFQSDPALRRQCLNALYNYGRDRGSVDSDLVSLLIGRITELWNVDVAGKDKVTGKFVQVRFRSSSNMEDGVEFNGAGLYESTTVCMADQFDFDTAATCDPSEDHEETIQRALKKVWMSLFLPRAFEERHYYQLPHRQAAMAVLVNTGTPDEWSNGVAFTGNVARARDVAWSTRSYYVHAQPGEISVVSPDPGVEAEIDELSIPGVRIRPEDIYVRRIHRSTALPDNDVLSESQLRELGWAMWGVDEMFPWQRGPYAPERVILDFEYKFVQDNRLILKQVRPFLIGPVSATQETPFLPANPGTLKTTLATNDVLLEWGTEDKPDTHVVIERLEKAENVWKEIATVSTRIHTYIDTQVIFDHTYRYRIFLENRYGRSGYSNVTEITAPAARFIRGDANNDGRTDISDSIYILSNLFRGGIAPQCLDAADANDDGKIDIADAMYLLHYLFTGTNPEPPLPGPVTPGPDPTGDALGCATY